MCGARPIRQTQPSACIFEQTRTRLFETALQVRLTNNRLQIRMDVADRAVLGLIETQLFGSGVVGPVIQHLADRLAETGSKATADRVALEDQATRVTK